MRSLPMLRLHNLPLFMLLFALSGSSASCAHQQTGAHTAMDGQQGERLGRELSVQIAEIMANNHVYETAVPLLREGIAEDPNNPKLHRLLGTVLRDRGIFDQALTELQLAWSLNDTDAEIAAALGVLYDSTRRPEAAEIWHRHALDLAPKRGELFNNLGFSLFLQGQDEDALMAFLTALRFNPNQVRAFNNLGFTYFRLGERQRAFQSFRQANKRAAAIANMGVAYELAGELDAARRAYQDALSVDRRLEVARNNLFQLAQGEGQGQAPVRSGVMPWDGHLP